MRINIQQHFQKEATQINTKYGAKEKSLCEDYEAGNYDQKDSMDVFFPLVQKGFLIKWRIKRCYVS